MHLAPPTEDERKRRIEEMLGNAEEHDRQRSMRLQQARDAEPRDTALVQAVNNRDAFLQAATKEVYGSMGTGTSLETRVNSRKHFNEGRS